MHIIMVQTLKIGEMRGNLRNVTVRVSIVLVETEWFGSLNYITVLVLVTDEMIRCHEEFLNTHNLSTSIAVPSLPSWKIRGKELPTFSCKCCAQCHESMFSRQ